VGRGKLALVYRISQAVLESDAARLLAEKLSEQAIGGAEELRTGAAEVLAHNLIDGPSDLCAKLLDRLLYDTDRDVQGQIASLTHRLGTRRHVELERFLLDFAASPAVWHSLHEFTEHLWSVSTQSPDWALATVAAILNNKHSSNPWDRYHGGEGLVRSVLSLIASPLSSRDIQRRGLDLFDELMLAFTSEATAAVTEWDRR
jgi:hypothetical protein